jgi:dihydroxyacetone synthase
MTFSKRDEQAVIEVRKLVIDCCRQNGGGHGGSAIGMAPLAVALWKYVMRYSASNPDWFDRDRFIMSNGHAGILLYIMLHLVGYDEMTMDDLKGYCDPKLDGFTTICHGHPEIEIPGVEVTTGPLGQGIANAVGMAIASKNLGASFNRPDIQIIQSHIYCTTGDACLQEGVALESISLAGHLHLDNLTLIYDNNSVTCDGPLEWTASEDINSKMRASGWNVIDVLDGDCSVQTIVDALLSAKSHKGQPSFVNIRTTIGYGTSRAGSSRAHHSTFSEEDATMCIAEPGLPTHTITTATRDYFKQSTERGIQFERTWLSDFALYRRKYPADGKDLEDRIAGKYDFSDILESVELPSKPMATREVNGYIFNKLFAGCPGIIGGGADLSSSTKLGDRPNDAFGDANFEGRFIRYGIREHAMTAIANGIAAFNPGTFIPVTATFFVFYLYAAAGVRMGALSNLQVIHMATHDSIAEGQNGPTHQAVELDSLLRAMPSLIYIRPADGEELVGAWNMALNHRENPTLLSLARDAMPLVPATNRHKVKLGGYVVKDINDAIVTIVSSGSELCLAMAASSLLDNRNIPTKVVSMPSIRLFDDQSDEYKDSVLSTTHIISLEPYIPTIWARYCTASIGMDSWGYSASGESNYIRFGLDPLSVASKVERHLNSLPSWNRVVRWRLIK